MSIKKWFNKGAKAGKVEKREKLLKTYEKAIEVISKYAVNLVY